MKSIKPLEGIKILDFSRLLPGPAGTHLLSTLGAEVIKIESPKRMDYLRDFQPKADKVSATFRTINHTKDIRIVDYETEEGKEEIKELIRNTDILIEQFRPGAMDGFGFSFEETEKINPKIVYISITGYGQQGEMSQKAGHDINYLALSGLLDLNRDATGKPVVPGFQLADVAGGSFMLMSACTAGLLSQQKTNKAQYIDISLADSAASVGAIPFGISEGGMSYHDMPILSGLMVNYDVYECQDGKYIAFGALEVKFWNTFCEAVGKSEWKVDNQMNLMKGIFDENLLKDLFKQETRDQWVEDLKEYDVCISPVLQAKETVENTHMKDREVFSQFQVGGTVLHSYQSPFKTYITE